MKRSGEAEDVCQALILLAAILCKNLCLLIINSFESTNEAAA